MAECVAPDEQLGNKVLLENALVRIWEHRVPPGMTGHSHVHRRPYCSVVITGTKGETLSRDGAVLEVFDLTPASIYWYGHEKLPETHALRNMGDDEILIVTTEFLR